MPAGFRRKPARGARQVCALATSPAVDLRAERVRSNSGQQVRPCRARNCLFLRKAEHPVPIRRGRLLHEYLALLDVRLGRPIIGAFVR